MGEQYADTGIFDDVGNFAAAELEVDWYGNRPQ